MPRFVRVPITVVKPARVERPPSSSSNGLVLEPASTSGSSEDDAGSGDNLPVH